MAHSNLLATDLDSILYDTQGLWEELRGQRIFITGGTGFFGCWLLESFAWANDQLQLGARAVVLTRSPEAFRRKAPHLAAHPAIQFHVGDVRDFSLPEGGFSHVLHAATEASAKLNAEQPLLMFDTVVEGTRRALELARHCGAKKFLLASSGAVYGRQPSELTHLAEDFPGGPDPTDPHWAYGEGKRAAEMLCALYTKQHGMESKIARCFAFVGPYLPLDTHFAVGNFIADALGGGPLRIAGDGTSVRSYLYASDLAIWLWTILFRGVSSRAYNLGSEVSLTIAEVAQAVRDCFPSPPAIQIAAQPKPGQPVARYVPSTQRAQRELGLVQRIMPCAAIQKTLVWHQRNLRV